MYVSALYTLDTQRTYDGIAWRCPCQRTMGPALAPHTQLHCQFDTSAVDLITIFAEQSWPNPVHAAYVLQSGVLLVVKDCIGCRAGGAGTPVLVCDTLPSNHPEDDVIKINATSYAVLGENATEYFVVSCLNMIAPDKARACLKSDTMRGVCGWVLCCKRPCLTRVAKSASSSLYQN
eukprot:135284-Amphidinium_carterae.1